MPAQHKGNMFQAVVTKIVSPPVVNGFEVICIQHCQGQIALGQWLMLFRIPVPGMVAVSDKGPGLYHDREEITCFIERLD